MVQIETSGPTSIPQVLPHPPGAIPCRLWARWVWWGYSWRVDFPFSFGLCRHWLVSLSFLSLLVNLKGLRGVASSCLLPDFMRWGVCVTVNSAPTILGHVNSWHYGFQ